MKVLVWTTVTYGTEGWTLKSDEKKRIQAAEIWFYRRLLNVTYKDRRTNVSILNELNSERDIFGQVVFISQPFYLAKWLREHLHIMVI